MGEIRLQEPAIFARTVWNYPRPAHRANRLPFPRTPRSSFPYRVFLFRQHTMVVYLLCHREWSPSACRSSLSLRSLESEFPLEGFAPSVHCHCEKSVRRREHTYTRRTPLILRSESTDRSAYQGHAAAHEVRLRKVPSL